MKKLLSFALIWISLNLAAEVITMDLSTATDANGLPVNYSTTAGEYTYYDISDVWDCTYNDSSAYEWIYTNNGVFRLSHLPSQNAYGGMSWEGFTLSTISQDTANVFGCVANGGLAGVATPYVIGYYSEWVSSSQGYSSNLVQFNGEYYPEYVYICQNSNTYKAITQGEFNARAFTQQDTLALIIQALDATFTPVATVKYFLAVDGTYNNGWTKVPLVGLGKTSCISFSMTSTDMGDWGANTPLYFAMDGLTINTNCVTALTNTSTLPAETTTLVFHHSQIYIVRNGVCYSLQGQLISALPLTD